jgi:hypothetical protein
MTQLRLTCGYCATYLQLAIPSEVADRICLFCSRRASRRLPPPRHARFCGDARNAVFTVVVLARHAGSAHAPPPETLYYAPREVNVVTAIKRNTYAICATVQSPTRNSSSGIVQITIWGCLLDSIPVFPPRRTNAARRSLTGAGRDQEVTIGVQ